MRLLKIGHDQRCDIVMHSPKVSALHAELTLLDSGDMLLEDKNSTNGTYIMNQRIQPGQPVKVRRGDAIRLADTELQWGQVPMPEDNSAYRAIFGVGSHTSNEIQIAGSTVSRYHATIKQGRDGKMYIVDHSKNGTTVNGQKISPNMAVRIKRSSVIVCGGVPVDTSRLPWPSEAWKTILAAAAVIAIFFSVGYGAWKYFIDPNAKEPTTYTDAELYAMYNNSVVMLVGVYHYEISLEGMDINSIDEFPLPTKLVRRDGEFVPIPDAYAREYIQEYGTYTGTGFFVSDDGRLVTNLHVAKPWLDKDARKELEAEIKQIYSQWAVTRDVASLIIKGKATPWTALTSLIKVNGVLDDILLIPQGRYFSSDNAYRCRVLSAGEDLNKDVALLQTELGELPNKSRYINVEDSMDVNQNVLKVGNHIYTLGFPLSIGLQDLESDKGIQVLSHGGAITQADTEFRFGFDAASYHGASGSPIFNEYGMLIGVLNGGADVTQGFNYAVKAKYVKELLESPYTK